MLRTRGGAGLIDRFVPTYQFVERHSRTISATPPRVYRALWEADFARSTVIRTLFMMRGLASAFRQEGSLQIRLADFRFARYWLIIRPFSGLIRRRMLAVLRDQVLDNMTQPG